MYRWICAPCVLYGFCAEYGPYNTKLQEFANLTDTEEFNIKYGRYFGVGSTVASVYRQNPRIYRNNVQTALCNPDKKIEYKHAPLNDEPLCSMDCCIEGSITARPFAKPARINGTETGVVTGGCVQYPCCICAQWQMIDAVTRIIEARKSKESDTTSQSHSLLNAPGVWDI